MPLLVVQFATLHLVVTGGLALPIQYVRRMRRYPLLFGTVPYCAFVTWKLGLAAYQFPIILLGGCVVLACGVIVRYFGIETTVRPLLEVISRELPADFRLEVTGLPLRWRLLVAAPIINVIAAVVVVGLTRAGTTRTSPTSARRC